MSATDRQLDVLRAIREYQEAKGYSPSIRELCDVLSISSTNGVAEHLGKLKRKRLITMVPGRCRTLQLTTAGLREVV